MIEIKTQVHTIIMLIGPSCSGKSTFAKEILIPQLIKPFDETKNFKPNIQYISSDDIRRELIGMDMEKYDNIMTESSDQAFKMLFTKLDMVTSYPINSEFVILDTTGLSEEFRNQVLDIAEKNNYNVDAIIFDYKKIDEYKKTFKSNNLENTSPNGRVIANHVKRLKTEVMKTMNRHKYSRITKIKSKDFLKENIDLECFDSSNSKLLEPMVTVSVTDYEKYVNNILSSDYEWIVIGDVHGCIDELKELIKKYGFEIKDNTIIDTPNTKDFGIVFIGDIVDKSSEEKIEETLRFIHKNMITMKDRLQLIKGNHEDMVWKWITNHSSLEINEKRLHEKEIYYNTTNLLEKDNELKTIFLEIFENMKYWVKTIGTKKRSFIATHAPCEIKFLEKMDKRSSFKQMKCVSRSKNPDKTSDELLSYLKEEAVKNQPVHIFGHMGQNSVKTFKNKVCIDTGCVYGHKLTGYTVNQSKPFIQSVNAIGTKNAVNHYNDDLFSEIYKEKNTTQIDNLNVSNQKRLNYIVENGINYIGGTISPADKDEETGELESLKAGLEYYKGKVDEVVLQPKYMGSRAQLYLNRDIEKCYATSRNGYKIKQDISVVFKQQLNEHEKFMIENDLEEILLDGELMPWAAIGSGLIDKQFRVIDEALKSEIQLLEENGFDEAFGNLVDEWKESGFENVKHSMSKKELQAKFGHAYNNYKLIKPEFERWQTIDKHKEAWKIYHEQVEIYGDESIDIHFKPFRLLKAIKTDGSIWEHSLNNAEQFKTFNNDEIYVYKFSDENFEAVQKWYNKITQNEKMEGCVIKPNDTVEEWVTPFLKVRNPNYLTIIYGYDMYFPKKFEKLFKQKNINKKIKVSISEYKLGEQMLKTPIKTDEFKQIVANLLFENEKEIGIDPRL